MIVGALSNWAGLMIADITWNCNLVSFFEGLYKSNPCRLKFLFFCWGGICRNRSGRPRDWQSSGLTNWASFTLSRIWRIRGFCVGRAIEDVNVGIGVTPNADWSIVVTHGSDCSGSDDGSISVDDALEATRTTKLKVRIWYCGWSYVRSSNWQYDFEECQIMWINFKKVNSGWISSWIFRFWGYHVPQNDGRTGKQKMQKVPKYPKYPKYSRIKQYQQV